MCARLGMDCLYLYCKHHVVQTARTSTNCVFHLALCLREDVWQGWQGYDISILTRLGKAGVLGMHSDIILLVDLRIHLLK